MEKNTCGKPVDNYEESAKTVENLLKEINEKLDLICETIGIKKEKGQTKGRETKKALSRKEMYDKAMAIYERGNNQVKVNTK